MKAPRITKVHKSSAHWEPSDNENNRIGKAVIGITKASLTIINRS